MPDETTGSPMEPSTPPPPTEGLTPQPDADAPSKEQNIWEGRGSARAFTGWWILYALLAIVLIVVGVLLDSPAGNRIPLKVMLVIVALAGLVLLAKTELFVLSKRYRLTTQRIFYEVGIFSRTSNQTDLIRVNDVRVTQTLAERVFNVGDVLVDCPSDVSNPQIRMVGIPGPHEVAEHVHREMRRIRDRRSVMLEQT